LERSSFTLDRRGLDRRGLDRRGLDRRRLSTHTGSRDAGRETFAQVEAYADL